MSSTALPVSAEPASVSESAPWFIEFLAALIRQAPRPGEGIHQAAAEYWLKNQSELRDRLETLLKNPNPSMSLELLVKILVPALPQTVLVVSEIRALFEKYGVTYSQNFEQRFLIENARYQNPLEPWDMRVYHLATSMADNEIISCFGKSHPAVSLASVLMIIGEHARKERLGVIVSNRSHLLYVCSGQGEMCTVRMTEHYNRRNKFTNLHLDAFPATGLYRWGPGDRVFSRVPAYIS